MLLAPYRVLDLTSQHGTLCGQVLGDLGADVIQIEPPGGATGRRIGPFAGGQEDPEASLYWWGHARGKRSIELDIDQDRAIFLQLVARADILIEAEPVGTMADRGIDYAALSQENPALIVVSMTPFGSTGPKAHWHATDLTLMAAAGPMAITGDDDRPPVRVSVPQAWSHAAAEALVGALVALHERNRSGVGQHVEISAQQAIAIATQGNILAHAVGESTAQREAGGVKAGEISIRLTYPAKDGFVSITHIFGATVGPVTRRLMEYVYDEGFCDAATRDKDWVEYGLLLATGAEPLEEFERVKACVAACTASKTKDELLRAAMERRLLLAPMTTIEDVVESPQYAARDYFVTPPGSAPSAGVRYPGAFARFSETPLNVSHRPPRIGEHTAEVLSEIDTPPPIAAASTDARDASDEPPLKGVKVLDFMWALAGPGATRTLADWGATVVRIESTTRLDVCRTIRPFIGGDESPEKSAIFHSTNAGKRMITVNPNTPEGRDMILDLVRWADVVTESFSPRAMKGFGLDYETLKSVNPEIIMLSTCLMGQTGPLAMFAGYGNLAAALTGFYQITGWPDREPAGPFGAYTDYIAPRFNAAAVLAALDHRRRTGVGQHIDLAQAEAAMHFLTPAILDYTVNGNVQTRNGNLDAHACPHGVYATDEPESYVAIACETDAHWQALCDVLSIDTHDQFTTLEERLVEADDLDAIIGMATREHEAAELEAALQAAGVPASRVQNSPECVADVQLNHLNHFVTLPHPEGGETVIEGPRFRLSRSSPCIDTSAPTFGRDLQDILTEVLGYDDEKFGELLVAGALE